MFTADFQVLPSDFASTEITFAAVSQAAKDRIHGAISFNVRKSTAQDVLDKLEAEGFKVEV